MEKRRSKLKTSKQSENSVVIKSLVFKFLERVGYQGVAFLVQIFLARLLDPTDYGMLTMLTIFISVSQVFVQSGLNTALIQRKDVTEKDYSSISTNAAIEASKNNGITVGITGGTKKEIWGDFRPTVLIPTGLGIGGGREYTLVLSCDVIIAISGGSGTLNEIAVAYQAGIPIVVVDKFGGWASKLSGEYLDDRKRLKCVNASTPKEALDLALSLTNK